LARNPYIICVLVPICQLFILCSCGINIILLFFFTYLTLIRTSCIFYLIRMSWVPYTVWPSPPAHTDSLPPSDKQFHHSSKIEYSDNIHCSLGFRHYTDFFKTDSKSLLPDSSGHIFNLLSWVEKFV
jgi:hypothetical protein